MQLQGKRVVVVGLGASGRAAARLAASRGARVVGVDRKTEVEPIYGVELELGPHRVETFASADVVVVSPGVPATIPELQVAKDAGAHVLGELALAFELLHLPVVAISGTNGKSTVTHFTGRLLQADGYRPFVGGNLGTPLSLAVLEDDHYDVAVVEVSSYQLELPGTFHPRVGVVLNLSPDHLGRHGDMDTYAATKCRLFAQMGPDDVAILPYGDERLARAAEGHGQPTRWSLGSTPGVVRRGDVAQVHTSRFQARFDLSRVAVPGEHNRDNAATAALLAMAMGARASSIQRGLDGLTALQHRMEVVGDVDGVQWINDSKATNIDATRVGIGGLGRSAVVLLGGQAKGPGFHVLADRLKEHRAVLTFGASGPDIARELLEAGVPVLQVDTLAQAVARARGLAQRGDVVLLSPGCASFDAFDNFEHRGRVFRELVQGGQV